MLRLFAIVGIIVATPAFAENWTQEAARERAKVEAVVKDALNDPDSVKFDSMVIYKVGLNRYHGCGTLRAKNAYGGYVRQTFVVTYTGSMPVYVGRMPLSAFGSDCSGEVIYSKG